MWISRSFWLLLVLFVACIGSVAQVSPTPAPIDIAFTIGMSRPHTHMFEVDIRIKRPNPAAVELLIMPVWTPGSYLVREFARNVQDFSAKDATGQALNWEKTNKNTWRITTNGATEWHVRREPQAIKKPAKGIKHPFEP